MINIKHQSRLKVLQKFYYLKRDISTTLVEAVFKLMKVQNNVKFQYSVFIFLNRGFHAFVLRKFPLSLFNTLSCPYLTTAISIPNDSPSYHNTYFSWKEFWCVTSRNACNIPLCVPLLQRMTSYL